MLFLPTHHSTWSPPRDLPRLDAARVISFDTETYDPRLKQHGPGWATRDGYIVGVSVATPEQAWYVPIRNALGQCGYHTPDGVLAWLRDSLGSDTPKVGANLTYDIGWLATEGVKVGGRLYDVQHAESLLSSTGRVALDRLGTKYLGIGKTTEELYDWCAAAYGGEATPAQRANIYRAPMELVGPYAESDAALPLRVLTEQWPKLHEAGLTHVFDIECRLIPLLIAMRQQGVRVDVEKAEMLYNELSAKATRLVMELSALAGREISVHSSTDLGTLCDTLGIKYNRTAKTQRPQFQAKWMKAHTDPTIAKVLEARQLLKLANTFLKGYIIDGHTDGVIHCTFNQLHSEDGGARTGRFSSSTPNLQNIPIRSELGKLIRSLFVPFDDDTDWLKLDYSQIEYRFLAHYAVGAGADDVRQAYNADPTTDYHSFTQTLVHAMTGLEIPRGPIKNINFGLLYGMGINKLATQMGVAHTQALDMFKAYHHAAPYVNATMQATQQEVRDNGHITTILGRRTYFDTWVPLRGRDYEPLPLDAAVRRYGASVERAFLYKALNYRLQGSAADMMKTAMVVAWERGLFKQFRTPVVTVHDELDFSWRRADTDPACIRELISCLETALPLRVPVIADAENGTTWGTVAAME